MTTCPRCHKSLDDGHKHIGARGWKVEQESESMDGARDMLASCKCETCQTANGDALDYFDRSRDLGLYAGKYGPTTLITDAHIYAFHVRDIPPE